MSSRLVVDGTMRRVGVSPRGEGEGGLVSLHNAEAFFRFVAARSPGGAANVEALLADYVQVLGRSPDEVAPPPPGLSASELAALRERTATSSGDSCPVCLSPFRAKKTSVVELPCRHVFCAKCTTKWMESHTTCPLCRLDCRFVDVTGAGRGGKQALDSAAWLPSPTRPTASPVPSSPPDCPRPSPPQRAGSARRRPSIPPPVSPRQWRGTAVVGITPLPGSTARESARLARPASARPVVSTLNMPPRSPRRVGAAPRGPASPRPPTLSPRAAPRGVAPLRARPPPSPRRPEAPASPRRHPPPSASSSSRPQQGAWRPRR